MPERRARDGAAARPDGAKVMTGCRREQRPKTGRLGLWRRLAALAVVAFAIGISLQAHAVAPDEILKDPVLEARARTLSRQLRCLVCQNQSIDDSDAPLAHDLRVLLRERLVAGDTDTAAMAFIVERYGTFVLLKPPLQTNTLILWLAPLLLLLAIVAGFWQHLRREREAATPQSLTSDEQKRLDRMLEP